MKQHWKAWPATKLGWASLVLIVVSVVFAFSISVFIEIMNSSGFEPTFGFSIGIVLVLLVLVTIVLGWVSVFGRKERSIVLLVALSVLTGLAMFFEIGEVIEILVMSASNG